MKITKITQQVKQRDRYSVYVDDVYSFSLSEGALLESGIVRGQELTTDEIDDYKKLSVDDKLYLRTLRYVAMRPRSTWEVKYYLQRKDTPDPVINRIVAKLTRLGMLDDAKFAASFVRDRRLLRAQSTRRLRLELQKKRISSEVIDQVLSEDETDERVMLRELIVKKRRQTKFQNDDLKLMQYLARQGFGYSDIKEALTNFSDER